MCYYLADLSIRYLGKLGDDFYGSYNDVHSCHPAFPESGLFQTSGKNVAVTQKKITGDGHKTVTKQT